MLYTSNGAPLFAFGLPVVALLGAVFGLAALVRERRLAGAQAMADRSRHHHQLERNRGAIEERNNDDKSFIRTTYRY
jgi:hypothetical protein